jgi:AcrR family transcriptional regulator
MRSRSRPEPVIESTPGGRAPTLAGGKLRDIATLEETAQPVALRADAARNRELIVNAAAELFAEKGLEVSTSDIAARAGVGEATLFRRFPVKQDLVDAVLEQKMQESIEAMEDFAADPDPVRGFERLFFETIDKKLKTDIGFMEAAGQRCMTNPDFAPLRRRSLEVIGTILKRAQEAGAVRGDLQPQDLSFLMMSAVASLRSPVPGLREDLWRRYTRVILDGLRPECASKLSPGAPPRKLLENPTG